MARKPLMAGNWKMNLHHLEAISLVQKLSFTLTDADYARTEVAVLPPFTDLRSVQTLVDGDKLQIGYGAQDLSPHDSGAYTGDISGQFLAKLGCKYVLVGHSERRTIHNETDQSLNAKVHAAYRHSLTPVLCVGEGLDIRQARTHVQHTLAQLRAGVEGLTHGQAAELVVAYEPVWAIGTGRTATPTDASEVHLVLRAALAGIIGEYARAIPLLYGGSVNAANSHALLAAPEIDGLLVGGASLDPVQWASICATQPTALT